MIKLYNDHVRHVQHILVWATPVGVERTAGVGSGLTAPRRSGDVLGACRHRGCDRVRSWPCPRSLLFRRRFSPCGQIVRGAHVFDDLVDGGTALAPGAVKEAVEIHDMGRTAVEFL